MTQGYSDSGVLVSELATDADMIDLIELFVGELPDRVKSIQDALERQDYDGLSRLAHQLKGAAGGYGFPTITDAAREVERDAKLQQDVNRLIDEVRRLTDLCGRARATPE